MTNLEKFLKEAKERREKAIKEKQKYSNCNWFNEDWHHDLSIGYGVSEDEVGFIANAPQTQEKMERIIKALIKRIDAIAPMSGSVIFLEGLKEELNTIAGKDE